LCRERVHCFVDSGSHAGAVHVHNHLVGCFRYTAPSSVMPLSNPRLACEALYPAGRAGVIHEL
jgi:hypothetical protein